MRTTKVKVKLRIHQTGLIRVLCDRWFGVLQFSDRLAQTENILPGGLRICRSPMSLTLSMLGKKKSVGDILKVNITKTYLYNVDPLNPHFYIVKLGFTGVDIIFLISAQNIDNCGYSLEPPRRGGSNEYHNLCFEKKYEKISEFFI